MGGNDDHDGPDGPPADGEGLWAYVTRTVRPLWREERAWADRVKSSAPEPLKRKKAAPAVPPPAGSAQGPELFLERLLHMRGRHAAAPGGDAHPGTGLDRNSDRRLKRGEMEIEARLDLHGHTRDAAHELLRAFIAREAEKGRRCVLVITGKGRGDGPGVLRTAVPQWLGEAPMRDDVLRFYPAQPRDGGAGALYILLRRRRDY
jgi:DNA-nicking Smr family endonuclease